jgi:hypothetical protein
MLVPTLSTVQAANRTALKGRPPEILRTAIAKSQCSFHISEMYLELPGQKSLYRGQINYICIKARSRQLKNLPITRLCGRC